MKKIRFGSKVTVLITLVFIIALVMPGPQVAQAKRSTDDWSLAYDYLRHKIIEDGEPHGGGCGLKCLYPYLRALDTLAKDRDEAHGYAVEANAEGNSYYYDKFLDLERLAQDSGDSVLWLVEEIFFELPERRESGACGLDWATICVIAKTIEPIYDKAKEKKFDYTYMQEYVGFWLDHAIDQVAFGHCNHPGLCWCCQCPGDKGKECALAGVDEFLKTVEKYGVRRVAQYYSLDRLYEKATNIMDKCLQDALCVLDMGHQWYIDLADQYGLSRAKEYIEGFYGTLYGKVEVEKEDGKREPAVGAKVTVTDPHDGKKWEATADAKGNYEIEKVILHTKCSPFDISAEYKGDSVDTTYTGPLAEPNPSARFEKNLVIKESSWLLEFTYTEQMKDVFDPYNAYASRDRKGDWEVGERTYTLTVKATLKAPQVELSGSPADGVPWRCAYVSDGVYAQLSDQAQRSYNRNAGGGYSAEEDTWSAEYSGVLPNDTWLVIYDYPDGPLYQIVEYGSYPELVEYFLHPESVGPEPQAMQPINYRWTSKWHDVYDFAGYSTGYGHSDQGEFNVMPDTSYGGAEPGYWPIGIFGSEEEGRRDIFDSCAYNPNQHVLRGERSWTGWASWTGTGWLGTMGAGVVDLCLPADLCLGNQGASTCHLTWTLTRGGGEATPIPTNAPAATQSPKSTETPSATQTPSATETPGNTATPAAITLVSPDKLGEFYPAAPPGWQQTGVQSQKERISGHDVIVAHNYYWPAGSSLAEADGVTISLYDYGAYYPSGHMPEAQQATVHGYPAWKLVQPETPSANLEVAINNRFKVDITCKYEDVLDQFSDLIDYAGIAALK